MKADKMIWFDNLKPARKFKGLSLGELATRVGIKRAQMGVIERQERGTPKKRAQLIAKVLDRKLKDLGAYRRVRIYI